MKIISFAVIDENYINPLRVMLKTFRLKNSLPFKVFKLGNFDIPEDLKNILDVEYIDFEPQKTLKWVNKNFEKFNKDSFIDNLYGPEKIINMFAYLEIADELLKEYDIVFKTDADIVYFENIEKVLNDFYVSGKSIGLSQEFKPNHLGLNYYFNAGQILLNSKKCPEICDKILKTFEEHGFEKFKYLDQDALNCFFDKENIFELSSEGCINMINVHLNSKPKVLSLHYNTIYKPFTKSKRECQSLIRKTFFDYLEIARKTSCDEEFLISIQNNIEKYRKKKFFISFERCLVAIIIRKMKNIIQDLS